METRGVRPLHTMSVVLGFIWEMALRGSGLLSGGTLPSWDQQREVAFEP